MRRLPGLIPWIALCAACSTPYVRPANRIPGLENASRIYTLTNLHPDEGGSSLYSNNLQQSGLLAVCTEVEITYADPWSVMFRTERAGEEYAYYDDPGAGEELLPSLERYFGHACPQDALDALTPVEKEGLRLGIAKKGMRREAVLLALGYPPRSKTSATEQRTWRYDLPYGRSFTVQFDAAGVVEKVAY